ncbi:hypothetical protein DIPPA_06522 [Diplonema papillatum]|nr:hypothetical protein DIPPA_06522 [Diplonema papillatum]
MSEDVICFVSQKHAGLLGEVGRSLLAGQSTFYKALLGDGSADWMDKTSTVSVPPSEADLVSEHLHFLRTGCLSSSVGPSPDSQLFFVRLAVYADRIGSLPLLNSVARAMTPSVVLPLVKNVPALEEACVAYMAENFEQVFELGFAGARGQSPSSSCGSTQAVSDESDDCDGASEAVCSAVSHLVRKCFFGAAKHWTHDVSADVVPVLHKVFRSDDLQVWDEGVVLEVALEIANTLGVEASKPLLSCIRLQDVALPQLDRLRNSLADTTTAAVGSPSAQRDRSESEAAVFLLSSLCQAYAHRSHVELRSSFLPYTSRKHLLFKTVLPVWPDAAHTFHCKRLHNIDFHATVGTCAETGCAWFQLTPKHTFETHVGMSFWLTVSGPASASSQFSRAFCDCQASYGCEDLGFSPSPSDAAVSWTLVGLLQFRPVDNLPMDCG